MKDAAKCDKRCEWQNSANQENAERILHFQVILKVCLVQGCNNIMLLMMQVFHLLVGMRSCVLATSLPLAH